MYSAHEGEKSSSFYGSDVTLKDLDRPIIDCALIERELSAVEKQTDTKPLEGKFVGSVVLAPMALAEIVLSTVSGSFLSDSALIDGTSLWKDSLGQPVADERITVSSVYGGESKGSIHRPELCLPAQGFLMTEPFDMTVDGIPFRVMTVRLGKSPPSTFGVKVALFLPRRMSATLVASRPRFWPSALTRYHF